MNAALYGAIIDGVLTGGVYALMAAGLTLIFGVMDVINIAQGAMVVLGAYLSFELSQHAGIDLFLGLLITIPALFVVGVLVEWCFMRRLAERDRTALSILVTYAVAIIIEGGLIQTFGVDYVQLHAWYVDRSLHVLGFYLPYIYLFGFGMAVLLLSLIYLLLYRTKFGRSVRATMQDRDAARLVGVRTNSVATLTFGIGAAVAAAGGMFFGAINSFNANSGYDLISRLLAIVILGGLGSMGGALGAAVAMTVVEAVVAVEWSPVWATLVFYAALVLILMLKPEGMFGRSTVRAQ